MSLLLSDTCKLNEHSISNSSGDVDLDELADVVALGLEAFEDSCELLSEEVSDNDAVVLPVPLELEICVHELPEGKLGNETEDSLVVVSDTGCQLAG